MARVPRPGVAWGLAAAAGLALLSPCAARQLDSHKAPRLIWGGTSGGFNWRWTNSDVTAVRAGNARPALSVKSAETKDFDPEGYDYLKCSVRPLSLVGSIVSYRRDLYWEGGA